MARIEFGLWANEQAVFAICFLILSSIVSARVKKLLQFNCLKKNGTYRVIFLHSYF